MNIYVLFGECGVLAPDWGELDDDNSRENCGTRS